MIMRTMSYKDMLLSLAEMNERDDDISNREYWKKVRERLSCLNIDNIKEIVEIAENCFGLELSEILEEYNNRID